ncbi:MAG: DUF1501 domain-containing protein [Planctomycetota bacterium]|nr:DUF1501 domain-containing protein [Planctomycetota bacterium]
MLRVLGSHRKLCNGLGRRDFLQAGSLGVVGLGLSDLLAAESRAATDLTPRSFGQAKRCILLFLYGSPSQLETFDMKPEAPAEIRGTMEPIASSVPGLDVCELLPETSKIMDRTTVVRSMTHPYPVHGVAYAMTGIPVIDVAMELAPHDPRHHPWFGSVVEYVDQQRRGGTSDIIQNVALPFHFSSQRSDQPFRSGPYGAFLGSGFNPTWTEFKGTGTVNIHKERGGGFSFDGPEPYLGCSQDTHFEIASTSPLPGVTMDRLGRRKSLLEQFDESRSHFDRTDAGKSLDKFQQQAFSLVSSPLVARALDTRLEAESTRDLYGMTLFGQGCLAARRLVESGTRLATVFWDEYGLAGDAWDTHANHYPRMKDQLMPGFDRAFSGLILDLEQRGMLDDTLVVCLSEHGRTPKLNSAAGGGRDHWSKAYSAIFAGAGIARGHVVGASDRHAAEVLSRPVSPKDALATMYHLLGIDPHSLIHDRGNRPIPLVPENNGVVSEMLA